MPETKLIEQYIRERGLMNIISDYKLHLKSYPDRNVIIINHQRFKTEQNDITIQCRGVVLHEENGNYNVICRPMDKFYNDFEKDSEVFSYTEGVDVYEKADGSLIKVYHHNNQFEIATNRTAFAEGPCNGQTEFNSYKDFVLSVFGCANKEEFQVFMKNQDKNLTYMFEFVSPHNKIITEYKKSEMILLAARHTKTGAYVDIHTFPNARKPIKYNKNGKLYNKDDCKKLFCSLRDDEEGFVLINTFGLRQKLKNPPYLERIRQNRTKTLDKQRKKKSDSNTELVNAVVKGEEAEFDGDASDTARSLSNRVLDYAEKENVNFIDLSDKDKTVMVWRVLNPSKKKKLKNRLKKVDVDDDVMT